MRIGLTRGIEGLDLPICWNDIHILPEYGDVAKLVGGQRRPVYRVGEEMYGCSVDRLDLRMYPAEVQTEVATQLALRKRLCKGKGVAVTVTTRGSRSHQKKKKK